MYSSILESVEAELWREVDAINEKTSMFQRLFDTKKISKEELTRELDQADVQAGSNVHETSWEGETLKVNWPLASNLQKIDQITQTVTETKPDGTTTTTTSTRRQMAKSPLQGLGQKLGLAKHNAEIDAQQISAKVDELEARRQAATPKVMAGLDAQGQDIGELEAFVSDMEKATNG